VNLNPQVIHMSEDGGPLQSQKLAVRDSGATGEREYTCAHLTLWSNRNLGVSLQLFSEMCLKMQQDCIG